jgi:HEPN domain-containing protein
MKKEEIIKYWLDSSGRDFRAMESMFKNGHYLWALFLGHLVLEKLLKAIYVKNIDPDAPYIHNLNDIAEKARLSLTDKQKDLLDAVSTFNIKARYPDYKGRFYKKADRKFTDMYLKEIKDFRKWIMQKLKK